MFRHCIFCHGKLPGNESVEHFPVGRRIAYDPHRGRLWAVCPSCTRWNLAPFEDRWEALEELERAHRDRGRVLSSTDNIALIRADDIELVRVGMARLREEAWWRYGQQMLRRRTHYRALRWTETVALFGASIATGGLFYLFGGNILNNAVRYTRFGTVAWQGEVSCITCGGLLHEISFRASKYLHLTRDNAGTGPALHVQCRRCRAGGRVGEHQLEGIVAEHVLRRVMTYHHFHGATETRVRAATDYIDRVGSPEALARELTRSGLRMDRLFDRDRRTQAVALEIALNEDAERRLMAMELAELETRWRQEEEIAAIADGLLAPSLDAIRPAAR
ncbi:MAG TPA: hypothetical protein VMM12_02270 [Longimicrobiales bacterium]|nr:hypothetical protein [Longimicrobiales bacterium]